MVVEDNEINQKIALRMLERMGRTATLVDNGVRAYELGVTGAFDCILMDVQMPLMDGITATERIRERLGPERLPIVAMTANAMQGDREMCLEAGMDDYLSKPLQAAQLQAILAKFLSPSTEQPAPK